jgi:hypothetical protein
VRIIEHLGLKKIILAHMPEYEAARERLDPGMRQLAGGYVDPPLQKPGCVGADRRIRPVFKI